MGFFDKKEQPKEDFSNVRSGSSTQRDTSRESTTGRTGTSYTVKSGDTLSAIAQREYGDADEWRRIFEANREHIDNPDLIHPGQELRIPPREEGAR